MRRRRKKVDEWTINSDSGVFGAAKLADQNPVTDSCSKIDTLSNLIYHFLFMNTLFVPTQLIFCVVQLKRLLSMHPP